MAHKNNQVTWKSAKLQAASFIEALAKSLTDELPAADEQPLVMYKEGLGSLLLTGEDITRYKACLDTYLRLTNRKQVSARTVTTALETAILEAIDIPEHAVNVPIEERTEAALGNMQRALNGKPQTFVVYRRIVGVESLQEPVEFGRVRFCTLEDREFSSYRAAVENSEGNEQLKADKLDLLDKYAVKPLSNQLVAVVRIVAIESQAAIFAALEELNFTLDLVNFLASAYYPALAARVRPYEGELATTEYLPVYSAEPTPAMHYNMSRLPGSLSIPLQEVLCDPTDRMRQRSISAWLQGESRTEYLTAVITAMKWAGHALITPFLHESFLLYAIALESLMLESGNEAELTYRLRLRVAHLLGKNPVERQQLFDRVKDLYRIRSTIVHNGTYEISEIELYDLRSITRRCILSLLLDSRYNVLQSRKQLFSRLLEQTLGQSPEVADR